MSFQLISRNPDLSRLRDEGYDVQVTNGHLVVRNIPYVTSQRQIQFGTIVSKLSLSGETTTPPRPHTVYFIGDYPCDQNGQPMPNLLPTNHHHSRKLNQPLTDGLVADFMFSRKPLSGNYDNYHQQITTYASILLTPVQVLDPNTTAQPYPAIETAEEDSVFCYADTASSRAGIVAQTEKLKLSRVAIIGVGGTGSYVLDLVAKTPVKEIHIFDEDTLQNHNAFRAPGAASIGELRTQPKKVAYLAAQYSRMHRGIKPHEAKIDASNVEQLKDFEFVFLCIDSGQGKRLIVSKLEEFNVPFIDVGLGVLLIDGKLTGAARVTTSTNQKRDHVIGMDRISFDDGAKNNDYSTNIQIADLNALNAALAVIRWKKHFGFYADLGKEHHSVYNIDTNKIKNEDTE